MASSRARATVRLIHLAAACVAGLLLSVVTLSGGASLFRPELDRLVAAAPTGATGRADLDAVAAALKQRYPEARLGGLLAAGARDEWTLRSGGDRAPDARSWKVWTDAASGAWLGDTWDSALAATTAWIARFHHDLWWKAWGGVLVGSAGLALLVFVATGIWLWFPLRGRLAAAFRVRWSKGSFLLSYDLHRLLGMVGIPVFLLVGTTGAMFEFRWLRSGVHRALGGTEADAPANLRPQPPRADAPARDAAKTPASAGESIKPARGPGGGAARSWVKAIAAAEGAVPGGRAMLVMPPRGGEGAWRVVLDYPGNISPRGGVIATVAGGEGGDAVSALQDPRTMSLGGWVLNQEWGLHMGAFGGLATRVLWVVVALFPPLLSLSGFLIWWLRRRQRTAPVRATGDLLVPALETVP